MSGSGRKVFQPGEVLTASNVQNYLQDQAVMVFAGTAARGTALGAGTVTDGMMSYLQDTNTVEVYKTSGTAISGWEAPYPISPNYIINGGFDINQRNFTSTITSGVYGFDRWFLGKSGGTATYSSETLTPGSISNAVESEKNARLVTSSQSGSTDWAAISQRIENVRTLAGQTVTLSFWAKASTGTPNIGISLESEYGTGGTANTIVSATVQAITASWARYSFTVTLPTLSGKTITSDNYLQLYIFTSAGTSLSSSGYAAVGIQNTTIDIWGVQLEAGQTATSFRRNANSIQGELAACQRYFVRWASGIAAGGIPSGGMHNTTTQAWISIFPPVPMRAIPTLTESSNLSATRPGISVFAWSGITLVSSDSTNVAVMLYGSISGGSAGSYALATNATTAGVLALSAEL